MASNVTSKLKIFMVRPLVACSLLAGLTLHSHRAIADDASDAYDPFIDYNEYEVEDEEEADVNFFRQGRLLTAGFLIGERGFTQGMGQLYSPSVTYGLYLCYFFDMRFALQFSFLTSTHTVSESGTGITQGGNSPGTETSWNLSGTMNLTAISTDIKYYFNTQNLTKGIAAFNPYVIGGFTYFQRVTTVSGQSDFGKDTAMGFDLGAGFEIPILQKKMYIGLQGLYQIVNFSDQSTQIEPCYDPGQSGGYCVQTNAYPNGSVLTGLGILGVNF